MHLLLALLLQAQPSPDTIAGIRTLTENRLAQFDASVDEFSDIIESRFAADSDEPKTGLAVSSGDLDVDGLHPLIVTAVIIDSPAWRAGVRTGDRVTHVGPRRIEHETVVVFRTLTDGTAGPLELRILRKNTPLTLTIERAPITCLQRASVSIDLGPWRERVADMRRLSALVRSSLDEKTVDAATRYAAAHQSVGRLYTLLNEVGELLSMHLTEAMMKSCRFDTRQ